jgi:hypothetical protein
MDRFTLILWVRLQKKKKKKKLNLDVRNVFAGSHDEEEEEEEEEEGCCTSKLWIS